MPGRSIARFADTSYFLALLIPQDEFHLQAKLLAASWSGLLVTTDFVLVEIANHLSAHRSRGIFSMFHRAIAQESRMNIIPASRMWMQSGMELYEKRGDKNWS